MAMDPRSWNAAEYEKNARFVSDLGDPVLQLLAPVRGERILDVGCGDGALTQKIVEAGCSVIGLDSSPDFCKAARARGLEVVEASAEEMAFSSEFDAVFSNAALHWMKNPERVVRNVARALRPGGRFVAEMGGAGCVETIKRALIDELARLGRDGRGANPWYFPTPEEYAAHLTAAGFEVPYIELIPRPTPLPDLLGWLTTFSHSFTALLPESERLPYLERVRDRLEPQLRDASGRSIADYVRLRFKALLPAGIRVRKAVSSDLADVRSCAQLAYGKYIERIGKPPAPMNADLARQIEQSMLHVALCGRKFAGYVTFFPEGDHLHLEAVAVLPEYSGKGVGKALIGFVEQTATREGLKAVELYTNAAMTENLAMYPKMGYRETQRKEDAGYSRVFFRKTL